MCPTACGPLYKPGIDLKDTTCPCGFGYFDHSGWFVGGDRVRSGSAPSRDTYTGHGRSCPVRTDPRNGDGISRASSALGVRDEPLQSYFMPAEGVDYDTLKVYVARDGPQASARPTTFNGKSGYLIQAKQMPNREYISNIKADSARIHKLRQASGRNMPNWAPSSGSVSQVPERLDGRPTSGHGPSSMTDHHSRDQRKPQYSSDSGRAPDYRTQRMPSNPEYEQSYPRPYQQPGVRGPTDTLPATQYSSPQSQDPRLSDSFDYQSSLFEPFGRLSMHAEPGVYPYASTAQGQLQQPVVADRLGGHERTRSDLPMDPRTELRQSEARSRQTIPRSNRSETRRSIEAEAALTGSAYSPTREQHRASTLAEEYPRHALSQDQQRLTEPHPERLTSGYAQRDREREVRYTDPRTGSTVVASSVRRAYTDPRDQPNQPTFLRREPGPAHPDDYSREDETSTDRSLERGYRRR